MKSQSVSGWPIPYSLSQLGPYAIGKLGVPGWGNYEGSDFILPMASLPSDEFLDDGYNESQSLSGPRYGLNDNIFVLHEQGYCGRLDWCHLVVP